MMKNVMVGNVGGTEIVGINDNGVGSVVCKLEDVPEIVKERDRLRNGLHQLLDGIEDSACHVSGVISLQYEIDLIKQLLNGETK